MMSPPGATVVVDGRSYDYFGGTGYLGLQGHPEVIDAACRAVRGLGVHTATSRTRYVCQPVLNVERLAAGYFDREAAFYFVSGYVGNTILVQSLRSEHRVVFVDDESHYSVTEAGSALGCPVHRFRTRDPEDLRRCLRNHLPPGASPLVLTDGVFPSFGWIAPIDRYLEVLAEFDGAHLVVDDAHGFGTLGPQGRGTLEHFGVYDRANRDTPPSDGPALWVVGTASKALGGHGGILPGDADWIRRTTRTSHYFDGASPPAAPVAAATARALQLVQAMPNLRADLARNVARVRSGLRALGIDNADLPTPIVGFTHGDAAAMQQLHRDLADAGILVPYSARYSGVDPQGALRLAVFATHSDAQIDRLLATLQRLVRP